MKVTDPTWLECFGTDDSQLEAPAKTPKQKLKRHQLASKMINDTARLRDAPRERSLFDAMPKPSSPSVQPERC